MLSITPVRERISERFPVASFVVTVPPDRYFEVACATHPHLFRRSNAHLRTAQNFATSRGSGLLRAPAGQATYMIPPQTLRRFAGQPRLYYAVAAFRGPRNEDPILTIGGDQMIDRTPSIRIAPDFTGRSLDRGKIAPAEQRYGGDAGALVWGGDDVLTGPKPAATSAKKPRLGGDDDDDFVYDDGFDASLWEEKQEEEADADTYGSPRADHAAEPMGFEDAAELVLCGVEPAGYEDAPAMPRDGGDWISDEGLGYEDAPDYERAYGSRTRAAAYGSPVHNPVPVPTRIPPPSARYGSAAPAPAPAGRTHHERYGSAAGAPAPAPIAYGGEVDGYEDVPDLVRNLGPQARPAYGAPAYGGSYGGATYGHGGAFGGPVYGNGAAAVPAPVPPPAAMMPPPAGTMPASAQPTPVRFPDFSDDLAIAQPLPPELPATDDVFAPADARHRLRILERVAVVESGEARYKFVAVDPMVGVLWGYAPADQKSGALGHLLRVCHRRDRDAFIRIFGAHNAAPPGDDLALDALPPGNLLRVTGSIDPAMRMAPVVPLAGGAPVPLSSAPWLDAFTQAGDVTAFQEAQREAADRRCYLPYLDFLRWLGVSSVRGHALFVDRALQMGGAAAARWFARVAGPVRSDADLRRALAHLGHVDVRSFQAAPPPGLTLPQPDGIFGALTHAAIAAALRSKGDSPLPLRSEEEILAALRADAEREAAAGNPAWQTAVARVRALLDDRALDRVPGTPARREPT